MADSTLVDLQPAMHNEEEEEAAADPETPRGYCFGTKISEYFRQVLSPRPDPAVGSPHPIMMMICEQELGKLILSLGVPVAVALVINNINNKAALLGHVVVMGLSAGCMAIWNGIVLRRSFQRAALVMEQLGILMVLVSFNALVASALPVQLSWVPLLCAVLCFLPYFLIPRR